MATIKELEKEISKEGGLNPLNLLKAKLEQTNEIIKMIEESLTNARRKTNTQIKDEQSMAHTHTAINQIDNEILTKLKGEKNERIVEIPIAMEMINKNKEVK